MDINTLKAKWNKEKKHYKNQELGSGIHSFVRSFLENDKLFNLKEGSLSRKAELRKNEYIHENKAKEGRRADFVIYISSEIVIPLEAECYGNIQTGIKQLFNYQKDFDKQYGILTDGYYWRFYNNNIYREFNLTQIFDESEIFIEFWKGYIKPESYYLTFFEPQGQLQLLKENKLIVEENKQIFFDDITKLIRSFKNKLQVEGYFQDLNKKERQKKAVEITYAYIIQFILYKTLVDNDFSSFSYEFKEIVKSIYGCLKVKQYGKILGIIEGISNTISQNIYKPFKKEQDYINQVLIDLIRKPMNELHEVAPWLDIFVFIKKYNFANIQNEIFGYIYENYLKELYEDTKKGQYFTDPAIVNFMLNQIGYTSNNLTVRYKADQNSLSIIDPSCGSGTFLYSSVNSIMNSFEGSSEYQSKLIEDIINKNVFGLDIEEFPLYLAEMNILMRMLSMIINEKYNNPIDKKIKVFLTKDSISEFLDTKLNNTYIDQKILLNKKGIPQDQPTLFTEKLYLGYSSYVREEGDIEEMKKNLENQLLKPRLRFDFVVGNPPYISYNESSKQGVLIVKLIQNKKISMSNIYGVNLNTVPGRRKPYSPKPNLFAFFIALGIALLKDKGKLSYIVPQTLLTAGDLDVMRYHLAKFTTIEKIITFSRNMFVKRGLKQNKRIATSSLIFILNKQFPSNKNNVEVINYTNNEDAIEVTLQNILENKKIYQKTVPQKELLENVANWNFIKHSKEYIMLNEIYNQNTIDINTYRSLLDPVNDFSFDGGVIINNNKIKNSYEKGDFEIFNYRENNWNLYSVSKSNKYYKKNSPMNYPAGSQGIKTYLKKFKILWRTRFTNNFQFTEKPLLLINNQSLIVSSNSETELLFYFSLLNSFVNKTILAKNLKQENEKNYFVALKSIKSYIKIPKINNNNSFIKKEIIGKARELLNNEKITLSDYVDFSSVMWQKVNQIIIKNKDLILQKDERQINLTIKEKANLIKLTINENYITVGLRLEEQVISVSDLKKLPIIDMNKQKVLKNYIDDLVFALYFNIRLNNLGINNVRNKCVKHPAYKLFNNK